MVACQIKFKSNQSPIASVTIMLRRGSIVTRSAGHRSRLVSGRGGDRIYGVCVCLCVRAGTGGHQHPLDEDRINEEWMFIKRREIYFEMCNDQVLDVTL